MKKFSFILCTLLISVGLFAQKGVKQRGVGLLETYVGTWVYQSNDTIFKINLQKSFKTIPDLNVRYTVLYGAYLLSVKGKIIDNYLGNLPTNIIIENDMDFPDNLCIDASNLEHHDSLTPPPYVGMVFYDKRKRHFDGKGISGGYMKLLSSNELLWHLDEKQGIWWETEGTGKVVEPIGFSVPNDVILKKEK